MPVIYDKETGRQWLEESFGDQPMILAAVLQPLPSDLMEAHEVSTLVNSPEMIRRSAFNQFYPVNAVGRSCRSSSE
jgi:putative SOS response-associated peptidase YedK